MTTTDAGSSTARNGAAHAPQSAFGADVSSPIVPVGVTPRYPPPRANIGPDTGASWLKRAFPIVRAHKMMFTVALVASFVGLLIQVLIPAVVGNALDEVLKEHPDLDKYVALIALLACLRWVFNFTSRLYMLKTAYRIEYDLRNIMYEHLSRMSFSFYDRVQSGQLISRGNSDIRQVQMYLAMAPIVFVQCGVAVLAFGLMLTINVQLAFVAMSTIPFVFIVAVRMRRYMFPVSWLTQARLADVATIVDENINGVRVVKSFAAEKSQLDKLTAAARKAEWSNVKDAEIRARWAPLVENLPRLGTALVLLYGGYLVINGQANLGDIVAFNAYVLMMQPPFRQLGMIMMMGQRASASAQRIYEVLDEQPTVVDRPGAVDLTDCRGDVRFADVSFDYASGTHVLDHFDLHLRPGETVALVGRTGTGKSTAARLLARFYDVSAGSIEVDGHDVRDVTLPSLRHQIGMVLDEPFLFSTSIRDNIAFGRPDAPFDDIVAAAQAAGADEFIRAMPEGYDTVVGERGFTLSGGQRQRIAIARTLVVNPPILVLDDATSAIDVQIEQQIHAALRSLMHGRTTLIIAHRLSTISLADRVAVVDRGRVIAEGTHAELLEREPRYAEILAQTEEDARRRAEEQQSAARERERADAGAVARAVASDVETSRDLDADIAVMADLDPELTPDRSRPF